ncbi:MAG TPA: TonB-dependent receptor [Croceibacterium sp.]|nr:TonB-dependent receptor [Croceibacterium sp.]
MPLAVAQPATAQEQDVLIADPVDEASITVLANGARQAIVSTGQSVTAFTREEIDSVQGADLTRLLERAPGVSASRNGGPGNFTALRVRGAEGEQLLVLVDGVRVADPAAPGGGFDLGNLLMGNLAKVELLRSSNSTIWGSQALGGVLAVTTGGDYGVSASGEYGAHDSVYGRAGGAFAAGPARLDLRAAQLDSDGFSAAAAGAEADGFRQSELAGRATVALARGVSAFASGRYADGRVEIDGFPAPLFALADTAEFQDTRQLSGAAGLGYSGRALDVRATLSAADTERDNFDPAVGPAPGYTTDGTSERAELRGRWRFADGLALDFGGEREWLRFSTLFDPVRRTAIAGGYAQLDYEGGPLHLAAGLRRDAHRDFGGEWSLGADAVYRFAEHWRVTASYGEGFKAPTLFQLHSDFGNAALQPERSRSYDLGVGYEAYPVRLKATAFRRDTRGLIGFVSCFGTSGGICAGRPFGTYDNIGRARAQGLELEAKATLRERLTLGAAYTWLGAEDRTPGAANRGNALPRRPRHALTASLDWAATDRLSLGADLRAVSRSFDDAANAVRLGGYQVLTLRGEWTASDRVALFARVENAGDERYQTAAGYATPGRGAYLGARVRL